MQRNSACWINGKTAMPRWDWAQFRRESEEAWAFHRALPGYAPTPLRRLRGLAGALGIGELWLKDESIRFGLKAFKGVGASFAAHKALGRREGGVTLCTATDGNHGRAVAWTARALGHSAVVFLPRGTVPARIDAIRGEGAATVIVDGTYDEAVRAAATAATEQGWLLIQDMAWDGYAEIPRWIMAGYTTILREMESEVHAAGTPDIDLALLQVGVGSWAAAAALYYCLRYGARRPALVCVEPVEADCLLESARLGRMAESRGNQRTIMAGLNCGTLSTLAWEVLKDAADGVLAIPDDYARQAMRRLARPVATPSGADPMIVSGESGAAGLAGLLALMADPDLAEARARLGLDPSSRVLLFNTEGDTDPESYRRIVAAPA